MCGKFLDGSFGLEVFTKFAIQIFSTSIRAETLDHWDLVLCLSLGFKILVGFKCLILQMK